MSDSLHTMDYSLPGPSVHGILQARYWRGLPCPPQGDLPDPRTEPESLMSLALAGGFSNTSTTGEALLGLSMRKLSILSL